MEIKLGFCQKDSERERERQREGEREKEREKERDCFSLIYKQMKHVIGKNFLGAYK